MNYIRILVVNILFLCFLFSQFMNVSVSVDAQKLRGDSKNNLMVSLENEVESYLISTEFVQDATDLVMVIDVHFIVESIIEQGNDHIIKAKAFITNRLDQQFFSKAVDFPFSQGQSLLYSPVFEPLTGFLDYFAFMIIAGELDTYDQLGGTAAYNRAGEIANEGKSSINSRGWEDRWKKFNQTKDNIYLREAKLYYYIALDNYYSPKPKPKELVQMMTTFLDKILEIQYQIGNDRNTFIFLKAHADETGKIMKSTGMIDELMNLYSYDTDNKDIYLKYLPNEE